MTNRARFERSRDGHARFECCNSATTMMQLIAETLFYIGLNDISAISRLYEKCAQNARCVTLYEKRCSINVRLYNDFCDELLPSESTLLKTETYINQ